MQIGRRTPLSSLRKQGPIATGFG